MRLLAPWLLLLCLAAPSRAGHDGNWHETLSPQLQILHQAAFLPRSFLMDVGRIHSRLKLDLSMFAPWMAKDRIKIYLYRDRESFLRGEFHPPAWSNGIAFFDRRTIATFVQEGNRKTTDIISHEMTHVLFESYWAEIGKPPPVWINEGLAMLEEARDPGRPEDSDWYQAMGMLQGRALPVARFAEIRPVEDADRLKMDKEDVTLWYVQAYSLVHFLYRRHTRLQFYHLVKGLRDGKTLPEMLWQVYRYRTVEDFEAAWRAWLKLPAVQQKLAAKPGRRAGSASPDPVSGQPPRKLKAGGFEGMGFNSFAPDGKH